MGSDSGRAMLALRRKAYREMSPQLRKVAKQIEKRLALAQKGSALIAYDIGVMVGEVLKRENLYGDLNESLSHLNQYLSWKADDRTLSEYHVVSQTFRRDVFERELSEPMANGRALSFSHFAQLAHVTSHKRQSELLKRVREECLSVRELADEITACGDRGVAKRGGGRKQRRPTSAAAGLHRLAVQGEAMIKYVAMLDDMVFNQLLEMPASQVDDALLGQVEEAQGAVSAVETCLRNAKVRLRAVRERLDHVIRLRKSPEPEEEMQPA